MLCPKCKSPDISVIDSREYDQRTIRRRRECEACKHRFSTYERIEAVKLQVLKRTGRSEPFERDKIAKGIKIAASDRLSSTEIEEIVDNVEKRLIDLQESTVSSKKIGNLVIRRLKKIDEVAYLRFASVYKNFQDINSFEQELIKLKK
jgi:transcriptional repressor NrdR